MKFARRSFVAMLLVFAVSSAGRAADEVTCSGAGAATRCTAGGQPWYTENSGADWTIAYRPGDLRFEVRHGDTAPWDAQHNHSAERTEISNSKQKEPMNSDIWFAFGYMVEPGAKTTARWVETGQLHATDEPGAYSPSPAWAQGFDPGDVFRIFVRTKADDPLRSGPAPITLFRDPAFERGRTYQFVYRINYSLTAGVVQAWRDGKLVADYHGPVGYVSRQGPFFKFGIYREPAPETLAVHYENLRFGGPELRPQP